YTYFTLYGKSLTSRNVKDNQLQIVLPATHSANMDRADSASAIEIIDGSLSKFKTSINRLDLLKKEFYLQRKYLQLLRKKNLN
ncbi:unnamed protein product, partial [Rotaria sp. Silwood1]